MLLCRVVRWLPGTSLGAFTLLFGSAGDLFP